MIEGASVRSFFETLGTLDIPFMVGGSLASSAHGNPRQTNDIDIVIHIRHDNVDRFVAAFKDEYMVSRPSIVEALDEVGEYRSFQISHYESLLRVDCFLPGHTEFERSEFSRRTSVEILDGLEVPVASAEDTVLRKLLWFDLGGRVSDRQWNDIVGVLEVQRGQLDEAYLDDWASKLGIKAMLDKACSQVIV